MRKDEEPKSELFRYAFGYSDKKPGWSFWLIIATMTAFIAYRAYTGAL